MGVPSTSPVLKPGKMCHIVPPYDDTWTREWTDTNFAIMKDLGIEGCRVDVRWTDVEKEKGIFKFRKQNGVKDYAHLGISAREHGVRLWLLPYHTPGWASGGDGSYTNGPAADMDDYANFIREIGLYFKPGGTLAQEEGWPDSDRVVMCVEFWNEPNGGLWKVWDPIRKEYVWKAEPERFAEMCNKAKAALAEADPGCAAMSGCLCSGCTGPESMPWKKYMEAMFEAGFEAPDIFGFTGYYGGGQEDLTPQQQLNDRFAFIREHLDTIPGGPAAQIWNGEVGAGSIAIGNPKREQYQADICEGLYTTDIPYWQETYKGNIAWTLLIDQNNNYNTGFSWGGLMAWPPTFPVPEELKKKAYDVMQRMRA